ncbi:hypothetical protein CAPTEDRAFT_188736 [Capitella teleta]|uniref:CS domain-containing protein n=1 Tax=Capitella teleta TaxID=283909 RepID=R7T664_CAPTE|nr:hypothetical protein CAPTEDRAFT_188736 [Capitella teleta]|eukprot:ELT89019.1 hypothetical protein CAPTEDRAFT_188736 [Capitella teleta]
MADEVEAVEETFRSPLGVTTDEEGENGIRVCVVIPGLKKKTFSSDAKNASIDFKLTATGFDLQVAMETKDKKKVDKYRYQIKKLPDAVLAEKCSHKVKENQVVLMLHKEKARSWARELSEYGLECHQEEEEEEKKLVD